MDCFARYFQSHGRLTRQTWLGHTLLLGLMCAAFGSLLLQWFGDAGAVLMALIFVWGAGVLAIQRLHDIGERGANLLLLAIPLIGPIWVLLLLCRRGSEGPNRYGPDPAARFDYLSVDLAK